MFKYFYPKIRPDVERQLTEKQVKKVQKPSLKLLPKNRK